MQSQDQYADPPTVGTVERLASDVEVKAKLATLPADTIAVGVIAEGVSALIHAPHGTIGLDVDYLHKHLLKALGIDDDAVRDEHHLDYIRGIDKAIALVREGGSQAAFLLNPAPIEKTMQVSLSGGVMPQKSTDFYPKLLTGLTIWKVDE